MIDIRLDGLDEAIEGLEQVKRQVPFALSLAANRTAEKVRQAEPKETRSRFNYLTKWTRDSLGIRYSNKKDQMVERYFCDLSACGY